jgi:hypothetical protein
MRIKRNHLAAALLLASGTAAASDDWEFGGTLYLWAAGIQGATPRGAEFDVGFDTLLDNLNMAFMGAVEARRGPWSVVADAVYMNVGADKSATVEVPVAPGAAAGIDVEAAVKTRGWVVNVLGAYTVLTNERVSLDALAGVRYLELKAGFDLGADVAGLFRVARNRSVLGTAWDGVVGVKGRVQLDDGWFLPYYADVGAGDSQLTWQLFGGVGYAFRWGEVSLVYRHIAWDFDAGDRLDDVSFSGPAAAVTWRF